MNSYRDMPTHIVDTQGEDEPLRVRRLLKAASLGDGAWLVTIEVQRVRTRSGPGIFRSVSHP